MKKAMALCMAAMLSIGASATAYAAPISVQVILKGKDIIQSLTCEGDEWSDILQKRLIECLPGLTFPSIPDMPSIPDIPAVPDKPSIPDIPEIPDIPSIPNVPSTPEIPSQPDTEKPDEDTSTADYATQVVELVNEERAKEGLDALEINAKVTEAAQIRAEEILSVFDHTRPDGRSCFTALNEAGVSYRAAGENIAMGQRTPEEVVEDWMNSPGHRANILGEQFTEIGVGYSANGWTQLFIG